MDTQLEFSVVIPVYNRRHLIARAVDSVLTQTYPASRVIVVDDGSTDGLAGHIAHRYGDSPLVHYVRQENQGPGLARNLGVKEATTDWVVFLDSDDEWYSFRLERIVQALTQRPDLDALVTGMDENVRSVTAMPVGEPHVSEPYTLERYLMGHGTSSCMAIKREWVLKISGFRQMNDHEDHDFVLRLIAAGGRFSALKESLGLLHTEESRHSGNVGPWYDAVFSFWRQTFRQYGLRGFKRRSAFGSLYLDSAISASEKGYVLRSFRYLLLSFLWMPLPIHEWHYGAWVRSKRLLRLLTQSPLYLRLWHSVKVARRRFVSRLNGGSVLVKTPHGIRMRVNANEYVGNEIMNDCFSPNIVELICGLLSKGMVVADVGGNIGFITLLAAKQVGVEGAVYTFEPVESTFDSLMSNIRLNRLPQITPERVALLDEAGEITFYLGDERNRGTSSVSEPINYGGSSETCKSMTFDGFVNKIGRKVDLVKVDIEGTEPLFLKGASATFSSNAPSVVIMECSPECLSRSGFSSRDLLCPLRNAGYTIYRVGEKDRLLVPLPASQFDDVSCDIVALSEPNLTNEQREFLRTRCGLSLGVKTLRS